VWVLTALWHLSAHTSVSVAQALDPIAQGTELLMSYFPIGVPRAQRQLRLQNDYGFTCRCVLAVPALALLVRLNHRVARP
jgi:hypothetical protein